MTSVETNTCAKCGTPQWIGDRFCRHCGTTSQDDSHIHEIDLADEPIDADPQPGRRINLLGLLGLLALALLAVVALGAVFSGNDASDDADREASSELAPTPLPSSGQPDNPPERQAAQNAFEAERERSNLTLAQLKDMFGIDGEIIILDRGDIAQSGNFGERYAPWSPLGPAVVVPYRIDPRLRTIIEQWEPDTTGSFPSGRWAPIGRTSSIPITAIAESPSHIATEAGARVSIQDKATGDEQQSLAGRLIPSTGNGFLVQVCEPDCVTEHRTADGATTGNALDASTYSPSADTTVRISPDGTMVAFARNQIAVWTFAEGSTISALFAPDPMVLDVAWLPDSSGLIVLGSDAVWIQLLNGETTALPFDVVDGWAIALTTPEG